MTTDDEPEEGVRCNRCGFCLSTCPIYRATGIESSSPRGHNAHIQDRLEGEVELTTEAGEYLQECLLCGACQSNCFPGVRTPELVVRERYLLQERFGQPLSQRLLVRYFLQKPNRLSLLGKAARWGGWIGSRVRPSKMDSLPSLSFERPLHNRLKEFISPPTGKGRPLVYFLGCGINYLSPQAGEATLRLLLAQGFRVSVPRLHCCGLPAYSLGDLEAARSLARKNLQLLSRLEAESIVVDCAGCSSFLKGYAGLLEGDAQYATAAASFSQKVIDLCQLLAPLDLPLSLENRTVTYHDPCHLRHHQGLLSPPRSLLQSIQGARYVELPEAGLCCGGAGTYRLTHPQLSRQVLERKLDSVSQTGADLLVTSCPACILQLSWGIRQKGWSTEVLHLSQVLFRSMAG